MDTPPAISTQHISRFRYVLFRFALVIALALVPFLLFDCLIRRVFILFLSRLEWPYLFGAGMMLAFLLAVLFSELLGMILQSRCHWQDWKHYLFIYIFCVGMFCLLPIFYFITIYLMVHPWTGNAVG